MEKHTPKNYIKRLIGLPGEIIAIFFGQLYRWTPGPEDDPLPFEDEVRDLDPHKLWQEPLVNHEKARQRFQTGQFEILRKSPEIMLALRRVVHDNDYPARDLVDLGIQRWDPARSRAWQAEQTVLRHPGGEGEQIDWLRYQHLVVPRSFERPAAGGREVKPQLITDMMGYNSFQVVGGVDHTPTPNWVGDLMLECNVEITRPDGEFALELSKGIYRYQARFQIADGACSLFRIHEDGKEELLDRKPTRLQGTGSHLVRFANFDARLTVWVDRELPFGEGFAYSPPEVRARGEEISDEELLKRRGPTRNDLEPASIGSRGAALTVSHLRIWRDTYYTTSPRDDFHGGGRLAAEDWTEPNRWEPLRRQDFRTWYVHPGHYLCLGDNSTASSDSREWGLVPDRLMLGRALLVYYPVPRAGPIR